VLAAATFRPQYQRDRRNVRLKLDADLFGSGPEHSVKKPTRQLDFIGAPTHAPKHFY
jgi:hypothetical protein